jgi:hypothetical protein
MFTKEDYERGTGTRTWADIAGVWHVTFHATGDSLTDAAYAAARIREEVDVPAGQPQTWTPEVAFVVAYRDVVEYRGLGLRRPQPRRAGASRA